MAKQDGQEYLTTVLQEYGCEHFKHTERTIRCGCPYHNPKGSSSAFTIKFPSDREPFFNCFRCHENGDLPTLISHIHKISYKKAIKRLGRKTTLGKVSIDQITQILDKICNAFAHSGFDRDNIDELPERSFNQTPMYEYLEYRSKKAHNILDIEWLIRKYDLYYCSSGDMKGRIIMPINIGGKQISYNDRSVHHEAMLKSKHPKNGKFENYVHGLDESKGKEIGIVVEGAFDMFQVMSFLKETKRIEKYGCVCLMNAELTETKASLVAGAFDKVVLFFDGDRPGQEGAWTAMKRLEDLMEVENRTPFLPSRLDPGKARPAVLERILFKTKIKKKSYMDSIWGI